MAMWVFGYGSLIWKAGFHFDDRFVGFIKGYRRVFYQGSTDHRGTVEYPGRTVTLEPSDGDVCINSGELRTRSQRKKIKKLHGLYVASCSYMIIAMQYLEVREKQYDQQACVDFFTEPNAVNPAVSGVLVYIASPDKNLNANYLGPASIDEISRQIIKAEGPSGPNMDYLFELEKALIHIGCHDQHVMDLANETRRLLAQS